MERVGQQARPWRTCQSKGRNVGWVCGGAHAAAAGSTAPDLAAVRSERPAQRQGEGVLAVQVAVEGALRCRATANPDFSVVAVKLHTNGAHDLAVCVTAAPKVKVRGCAQRTVDSTAPDVNVLQEHHARAHGDAVQGAEPGITQPGLEALLGEVVRDVVVNAARMHLAHSSGALQSI